MSITRRQLFIGTGLAGGGLILGFSLKKHEPIPNLLNDSFQPNAWLQITENGQVIFQLDKSEMGQGVITSLPTLIGEELDFDPADITVEFAGVHPVFKNKALRMQLTGGSTSIISTWEPLREAGATARAMLIAAAAERWGISIDVCDTGNGKVINRQTGDSISYFALVSTAKNIRSIGTVSLKRRDSFQWIGKSLPRNDSLMKIKGEAVFGIDVDFPDIKIALIRRCPHFGGKLSSYNDSKAKALDGVLAIFPVHSGVAVVAESFWQAKKAVETLEVDWDRGPIANLDSTKIRQNQQEALTNSKPFFHTDDGDAEAVFNQSSVQLSAHYAVPYFHHSPMEPQNTTALVTGETCEIWSPSQGPEIVRAVAAHYTGFKRESVKVNTTLMGGGFGRRGYVDFAGEAAAVAKGFPDHPVKLIWTREDDMQHDYYRPATYHGIKASLNSDGMIESWQHTLVSTSIVQGFGVDMFSSILPSWVPTAIARNIGQGISDVVADYDPSIVEGTKLPYSVDHIKIGSILYDPGIPTGFWRSVGHSHNAFVVESFIDECAHAAKQNPLDYRKKLLINKPRHLAVLNAATELSGFSTNQHKQGIAVHQSFGSFVAQVVEVSIKNSQFKVEKVFCAVDCGLAINPDIITQQMESGIIYALTAAIKDPVTFKNGATEQSNFHDLPVLRINESPEIKVVILDSNEHPTGVGEIAVPPLAPALANALFAATGERLRELPLKSDFN